MKKKTVEYFVAAVAAAFLLPVLVIVWCVAWSVLALNLKGH